MITHYGLYWSKGDVYWTGKKGNPGKLEGQEVGGAGRILDLSEFIGLYCLYNGTSLLYNGEAGITGNNNNLFKRLREHRRDKMKGLWDRFSWFGYNGHRTTVDVKKALAQLEAVTIEICKPQWNSQAGAFKGATEVVQVRRG